MKWGSPQHKATEKLRKFRDDTGRKMPMDSIETIARHKANRRDYILEYGPRDILRLYGEWKMFYEEIQRNAERKARYAADDERFAREAAANKKRAAARKERIAKERERDARKKTAQVLTQARFSMKKAKMEIGYLTPMVAEYVHRVTSAKERLVELSDEYLEAQRGSSLYFALRKIRDRKRKELPGLRSKLAERQRNLAIAEKLLADSYVILGLTPPETKVTPKMSAKATPKKWKPLWDRPPESVFRELENIPEDVVVTKVVLIRRKKRQDLRVFGDQSHVGKLFDLLFGKGSRPGNLNVQPMRGDYSLTREQYDKAGG